MNGLLETPRLAGDLVKVLLVEDSDGDARLVQLMLQGTFGHNIEMTRARSLGEALSLIDASSVDCAILDLGLPDAHGLEAVHALLERAPLMPIVVLTGAADGELATAALATGAQDYLVKGNTIDESLTRSIRYAVVRKAGEDALVRSQHALAEAQRVARLGSWELEFGTNAMNWSDEMCRLFACPPGATPSLEDVLGRLHPEDRDVVEAQFRAAVADRSSFDVDHRIVLPDDSTRWIRSQGRVEHSGTAPALRMHGTAQDITEQIRRAEEDRRERSMMEHRQRLELVGQLAGGLAHDFNNLLAAASMSIELSLEMLEEERRAGSDPVADAATLSETLDVASTAIERAGKLARQLLTLSRRDQASPEPVAIADFLEQLMPMLRASLGSKNVIRCEVTDDAPVALVDANQLEQVLLNLATNARDAMPDGGTLTINGSAVGSGERLRITVTDTGVGMDVATAARAFEPFFTTKTRQAGTGLGLAMVEQIIQRAHGTVEITSTAGSGTTIVIELPAADIVAAQPFVVEVEALSVGGDERQATILVVDDDDDIARLTTRMLRNAGYDVIVATSGREAIEIASSPPWFDLVLSDVVMPDMDGITLCDRLQQMHPTTQVLFMSGYAAGHLGDLGPDRSLALLIKPFARDALLAAVETELRRPPPEVQEHDAGVSSLPARKRRDLRHM